MITLNSVSIEKAGRHILKDVSVELGERRIGIIGRNGSGKSTFARLLNGLEKPTKGAVRFAGSDEPKDLRRNVGFVFQNPDNQIVYPIVSEDLEFGLKNLKLLWLKECGGLVADRRVGGGDLDAKKPQARSDVASVLRELMNPGRTNPLKADQIGWPHEKKPEEDDDGDALQGCLDADGCCVVS